MSFLRQAITLREKWMEDTCVRGRLCNSLNTWGVIWFVIRPAQRNFVRWVLMILSSPSQTADRLSLHDLRVSLHHNFSFHFISVFYSQVYFSFFVSFLWFSRPWSGPSLFHFRVLWVQRDRPHLPSIVIINRGLLGWWAEDCWCKARVFTFPVGYILGYLLVVFSHIRRST